MRINNTSALVTGGASGLGAATAQALRAAGATVTIFDRDEARAKAFAEELGGATSYVAGDVGDPEAVNQAVELAATAGEFRITVNCAGIGWAQRTIGRTGEPHDFDAFKTVVNVNLIGTFNVMRLAASAMSRTEPLADGERGVIVNTASVAAFEGQIGQISYSASKGGVVGMTVPAARDLAPAGIRVNTIAPGLMDTPLLGLLPEEQRQALGSGVLFPKRLGTPDEFGQLVVAIAENGYLNGETIRLDGGLRMPPK
ncbi:MAG: SDR family NAD(P)-dependent oxidoreductase [Acidimicrobiales bacterium]|jgi:NAD(P)-dependent dehydrogenase (short-subunit alcohol dehydrogenase family)